MSVAMSAENSLARSHFELVGGQAAVDRIVEEFYRRMEVEPAAQVIRALHPPDLSGSKAVLKRDLAEWLGGPAAYSRERGHSRLRMRHLPFRIGTAERDAWMLCMTGALGEVVGSNRLREYLLQSMSRIADWMRNDGVAR
jgi:hemoglobin